MVNSGSGSARAIPAERTVCLNAVFHTSGERITTVTHLTVDNQTVQMAVALFRPGDHGRMVVRFSGTSHDFDFPAFFYPMSLGFSDNGSRTILGSSANIHKLPALRAFGLCPRNLLRMFWQ